VVGDRDAGIVSSLPKVICLQSLYRSQQEILELKVFGFCLALLAAPKKHDAQALIDTKRVRIIAMRPKPEFLYRKCVFSARVSKRLRYKISTGALP
jgi:hypothetical protein